MDKGIKFIEMVMPTDKKVGAIEVAYMESYIGGTPNPIMFEAFIAVQSIVHYTDILKEEDLDSSAGILETYDKIKHQYKELLSTSEDAREFARMAELVFKTKIQKGTVLQEIIEAVLPYLSQVVSRIENIDTDVLKDILENFKQDK